MSDQTIFGNSNDNQDKTNPNDNPGSNSNNPGAHQNTALADLLGQIKNEAGAQKYGSVEDALKGAANAQEFIRTLQAEKAALQAERDALKGHQDKTSELERTVQELLQRTNDGSDKNKSISPEDIAELVNRSLQQRETQKTSQENQRAVISALTEAFGEEAEKKFVAAANEAGLSIEEMNILAAKSPKAILKMVGIGGQQTHKSGTSAPANSSLNTAGFKPTQESFVRRNTEQTQVGATTQELHEESRRAKQMVEEVHAAGYTMHDLSDPKTYFKYFGK